MMTGWVKLGIRQVAQRVSRKRSAFGARMLRLRQAFGPTQTAFCRRYGFTNSQWSNYEGGAAISIRAARLIKKQIKGITLDWIYDGDVEGLNLVMREALGELGPPPDPGVQRHAPSPVSPFVL
jgi:transcriptional regulator with XRE-family HTH domain